VCEDKVRGVKEGKLGDNGTKRASKRNREGEKESEREGERERESVCV